MKKNTSDGIESRTNKTRNRCAQLLRDLRGVVNFVSTNSLNRERPAIAGAQVQVQAPNEVWQCEARLHCISIAVTAIRVVSTCPVSAESSDQTRFHAAAMIPCASDTQQSLIPFFSRLFVKNRVLQVGVTCLWFCSFTFATLAAFDVLQTWWVVPAFFCMLPEIVFRASCFNVATFKQLCWSFQTLFVFYNASLMSVAMCVLWKDYPIKAVGALLGLPTFMAAGCVDAFPEKGRVKFSRTFFIGNLSVLFMYFLVITSGASAMTEQTFRIFGRSFTLTSVAVGSISSLVPFGAKNLVMSLLKPSALAVLKSDIVSVKLDKDVFHVVQAAYRLFMFEGKASNSTLHKMYRTVRVNSDTSDRDFREGNCNARPTEGEAWADIKNTEDQHDIGNFEDQFDIVMNCLNSIEQELKVIQLECRELFLEPKDSLDINVMREIKKLCAQLSVQSMDLVTAALPQLPGHSSDFRFHAAAKFPKECETFKCLVPRISRVYFRTPALQVGILGLWVFGCVFGILAAFDIYQLELEWLHVSFYFAMLPTIILLVSCLNKATCLQLCRTFQTIFVALYSLVLTVALFVLWRKHPVKIAFPLLGLPSFLTAGFMDAFPEKGRLVFSRTFFVVKNSVLIMYALAVMAWDLELDELSFTIFERSFSFTSLATNSIGSLFLFGVKNLVMSFL